MDAGGVPEDLKIACVLEMGGFKASVRGGGEGGKRLHRLSNM